MSKFITAHSVYYLIAATGLGKHIMFLLGGDYQPPKPNPYLFNTQPWDGNAFRTTISNWLIQRSLITLLEVIEMNSFRLAREPVVGFK